MWRVRLWFFHFCFKDIVRCRECSRCRDTPENKVFPIAQHTICEHYGCIVDSDALKWCIGFKGKA